MKPVCNYQLDHNISDELEYENYWKDLKYIKSFSADPSFYSYEGEIELWENDALLSEIDKMRSFYCYPSIVEERKNDNAKDEEPLTNVYAQIKWDIDENDLRIDCIVISDTMPDSGQIYKLYLTSEDKKKLFQKLQADYDSI